MDMLSTIDIINLLQSRQTSLYTLEDFSKLFAIKNSQSLYKKIARLEEKNIIQTLTKGKYKFLFRPANDFLTANFLYQPSYISLESALSFYGIITGFPYQITSITIKKPKSISVNDQEYKYSQFTSRLFWGYEKKEDFLIAEPEKCLLDYIYMGTKGLRSLSFDEMDLTIVNPKKLVSYAKQFDNKQIITIVQNLL